MADIAKLVEDLSALSVLEAADLVKALEEKWGVSAAAPVAVAAAGPAEPQAQAAVPTEFDVILLDAGAKKIDTIKVIRALTSAGLVEAKQMAETAGTKILSAVAKEAADDAKAKLEAAGAKIEVKGIL